MTLHSALETVRIGVSACLAGDHVRYDATHRRHDLLFDVFAEDVQWVTVCPEWELGLGAPREMIQLVGHAHQVRLITVETRRDITDTMRHWARARVEELAAAELDGFVLKARSPSCGLAGVKVHAAAGRDALFERSGRGLFAAALVARLPDLPTVEEAALVDAGAVIRFAHRVALHAESRQRN